MGLVVSRPGWPGADISAAREGRRKRSSITTMTTPEAKAIGWMTAAWVVAATTPRTCSRQAKDYGTTTPILTIRIWMIRLTTIRRLMIHPAATTWRKPGQEPQVPPLLRRYLTAVWSLLQQADGFLVAKFLRLHLKVAEILRGRV